ncbi:MAG: YraN family protein [Deltaproteobacteria bacterium]|nr:MAG: YraN family protein [Deltaproteobacteria bacterium]
MHDNGKPPSGSFSRNRTQGHAGEQLAVRHLKRLGYRILSRNYRCPLGEIDIVARHRGVLVFVEVKSRRSKAFGSPKLAVTLSKQRKLSQVAWHYLQEHNLAETSARFDVVTISNMPASPRFEVIQNAFDSTY